MGESQGKQSNKSLYSLFDSSTNPIAFSSELKQQAQNALVMSDHGNTDSTHSPTSPLSPDSPSAHPQPTICAVGSPRVCQFSLVSWLEDPLSPPPASESWTPPQLSDPAAPPQLLAPPLPVGPPAPPGSLVPPALPWSVINPPSPQDFTPPAAPRRSIPPALSGSSLLQLRLSPLSLQLNCGPPDLRLCCLSIGLLLGPPDPLCHPDSRPPGVVSPSSTMASPSVGSAVGRHYGCSLYLTWLLLLRVPSGSSLPPARLSIGLCLGPPDPLCRPDLSARCLLPLSAPLWAAIMVVAWISPGSSCSGSLLSPPWLLPPSDLPWTLQSPPLLLPPSSLPWTLFAVLLPGVRPPPEPPPALTSCCHPRSTPLFSF
ncbi:Obscurin [Labeo rohita]|uniref:Obscurin n=1 Tax=Labeo rohita TaxID=84645 RepID=A0ABQ8LHD4_LABRO|nr:Obscurin [Labeo rohita]